MKLKPILPSLKEKKRYVTFEVISPQSFTSEQVEKAVLEGILNFLGTFESGKAGILFLKDKFKKNAGVVKMGHTYVDKIRSALALIKKIDNEDVIFQTKHVSGILKKALSKAEGY